MPEPVVYLVDDDPQTLSCLREAMGEAGLAVRAFESAEDFFKIFGSGEVACLLLNHRLPKADGLSVLQRLSREAALLPTIVITADGDVSTCAAAFKAGAFDFLEKPLQSQQVVCRLCEAIAKSREQIRPAEIQEALERLTPRERHVFDLLVAGRSVKQIATQCNFSVQTAWKHRISVLAKFEVENEVELVRLIMRGAS